jgi:CheY-like chemotaxis protein
MPVMDGYAATNAIRELEAGYKDGRRVPIVALTAHALPEVRRRCFAVGMDDYLTKPFTLDQLRGRVDHCREMRAIGASWDAMPAPASISADARLVKAVAEAVTEPEETELGRDSLTDEYFEAPLIEPDELLNGSGVNSPEESTGINCMAAVSEDSIIRFETLESIVSLDPSNGAGLLSRLIRMYESNSLELLQAIKASFAAEDAVALSKAAHALKSSSGNVGAERLAALCKQIELAARDDDLVSIESAIDLLFIEHGMVLDRLHEYSPGELA